MACTSRRNSGTRRTSSRECTEAALCNLPCGRRVALFPWDHLVHIHLCVVCHLAWLAAGCGLCPHGSPCAIRISPPLLLLPSRSPFYDVVATDKWNAWRSRQGMSSEAAKAEFITLAREVLRRRGGGAAGDDGAPPPLTTAPLAAPPPLSILSTPKLPADAKAKASLEVPCPLA
ncbi:MAG: acyl-CoA-binding protein [Terracidiphilus sp.]|nr:acyl-CoA-binding protein [Terracidiphilus sp.]